MLLLICGLPRTGKTTLSEQYDNEIVIHLDNTNNLYFGVERAVRDMDGDVVVDGVYSKALNRRRLLREYRGDGPKKCIWLDIPFEVRSKRKNFIGFREEGFEPPTYEEGWDEIEIIRDV